MKFKYILKDNLPALAWSAHLTAGSDFIELCHGPAVECRDSFFVSGVWDGPFSEGGFDECAFACCTGAYIRREGVVFSTPNHLQDRVVSVKRENELFVSNSIALLLVQSGCELDPCYFLYEEDFCNLIFGLKKAKRSTPLKDGYILNIHLCCNIFIDKSLNINERIKKSDLVFSDYSSYRDSVGDVLRKLKDNAIDTERKHHYGMLSTISKGYDSAATSALVREIGCDRVLTFVRPAKYSQDGGTEIAEQLGYKEIIEEDGDKYLKNTELLEAEACACGNVGTGFTAFGELYKDCLFFVGSRGDSLFERLHANVNDDYDFSEGNGYSQTSSSFTENMLKNNSIAIPLLLIGGDRWSELARISNSEAMRPYVVGDYYDRPILRKILEDLSVPRESFGQKKYGAGVSYHYDTLKRLSHKMSPKSYESLRVFVKELKRNKIAVMTYGLRYYINDFPVFVNHVFSKLHIPFRLSARNCGKMCSPLSSVLILWGMDVMMKRYKQQLQ